MSRSSLDIIVKNWLLKENDNRRFWIYVDDKVKKSTWWNSYIYFLFSSKCDKILLKLRNRLEFYYERKF